MKDGKLFVEPFRPAPGEVDRVKIENAGLASTPACKLTSTETNGAGGKT